MLRFPSVNRGYARPTLTLAYQRMGSCLLGSLDFAMVNQIIVVTDDDSAIRSLIKEILTDEGYSCVFCGGRDEGFNLIVRERPALILLDIHGGDVAHGWKTLSRIRSEPRTASTPVIISTTDRHIALTKRDWLVSQACSVLEKPFDLDDLLQAVVAVIGQPALPSFANSSG